MNNTQVQDYLTAMTNEELKKFVEDAHKDTVDAATKEKDSEWHQNCFAALVVGCQEMNKRGIKRDKTSRTE